MPLLRAFATKERIDAQVLLIPLRRVATVEDISELVLFLVSPASDYITGATIDINGGELIL